MRNILFLFPVIFLSACSPRLQRPAVVNLTPLPDTTLVVVLEEADRFSGGQKAGIIYSSDPAIAPACTYNDIISRMQQAAREKGANLIKITDYSTHRAGNNCEKITANLYRVEHPKSYERKFSWHPERPLSWEDYKGNPSTIGEANVGARTSCRFGIKIDTLSTPGKASVIVTSEFICSQSSVRPAQQTPSLLAHEQLHFDLCEAYARSLRKTLAAAALTPANVAAIAKDAFLQTYQLYREQQALYDTETAHGLDPEAQAHWQRKIRDALAALSTYSK